MREGIPVGRSWWPFSAGADSPYAKFATSSSGSMQSLSKFTEIRLGGECLATSPVWVCAAVAKRGAVSVWLLLHHTPVGAGELPLPPINPTCLLQGLRELHGSEDPCQEKVLLHISRCLWIYAGVRYSITKNTPLGKFDAGLLQQ